MHRRCHYTVYVAEYSNQVDMLINHRALLLKLVFISLLLKCKNVKLKPGSHQRHKHKDKQKAKQRNAVKPATYRAT